MNRVLVTGGTGFVGRHLVGALDRAGWEVHSVSRSGGGGLPARVVAHTLDLADEGAVESLVQAIRPSALAHLAWVTEPAVYWTSDLNAAWERTSLHLIRAFLDAGGRRVLGTGTSAEYDWAVRGALDEGAPAPSNPTPYGRHKRQTFEAVRRLVAEGNATFAWARLFCPFGPHEDPRRLIPRTCLSLLRGETLRFGGPRHVRDFLHVDEVAEAIRVTLESDFSGAVNIGSGEGRSVQDLVAAVAKELAADHLVQWADEPDDRGDHVVASTRRLRDDVGFRPRLDFQQQIGDACRWWQRQPIPGSAR